MMSDYLPVILTVTLVVLTVVLVIVGILVIQVLLKFKTTLERVNTTIDLAESKINAVTAPLHNLGGVALTLGTGLKIFEAFVGWINRNKQDE